jgi:hypothetical protein
VLIAASNELGYDPFTNTYSNTDKSFDLIEKSSFFFDNHWVSLSKKKQETYLRMSSSLKGHQVSLSTPPGYFVPLTKSNDEVK